MQPATWVLLFDLPLVISFFFLYCFVIDVRNALALCEHLVHSYSRCDYWRCRTNVNTESRGTKPTQYK